MKSGKKSNPDYKVKRKVASKRGAREQKVEKGEHTIVVEHNLF
jgi:hypothetical protein